jgi:hypothetical protein
MCQPQSSPGVSAGSISMVKQQFGNTLPDRSQTHNRNSSFLHRVGLFSRDMSGG